MITIIAGIAVQIPTKANTNCKVLGRCKDIVITPIKAAMMAKTASAARMVNQISSMYIS